jgi:anti-sigma factor RsiW
LNDGTSMDCRKTQSLIHDFVDGTLDPADEKAFDRHASGCRECTRQIAAYRSIETNLGRMARGVPEGCRAGDPVSQAAADPRALRPARRADRGDLLVDPERWRAPRSRRSPWSSFSRLSIASGLH